MDTWLTELVTPVVTGVAAIVIAKVVTAQGRSVRDEVKDLRRDVAGLSDRVARIEGYLFGGGIRRGDPPDGA